MGISGRDRISVDLRGIRAAVAARAAARGMTVSELVREVLAREACGDNAAATPSARIAEASRGLVRVGLRMARAQASALKSAARAAALPAGNYVAALVRDSSAVASRGPRGDCAAALVTSCSVLTVLARDLRHLAQLLGRGQVLAAQQYRRRLDDVEAEVRAHLRLAAEVLGDLDALRAYRRSGDQ
jgi:hypothetical protein